MRPFRLAPTCSLLVIALAAPPAHAVPQVPALSIEYATGANPFCLAAGDLNGDGVQDLVVGNAGGTVSVMLGNGRLGYGPKTDYASPGSPSEVQLGDFNNDGRLDLAVACGTANQASIRLGDGAGGFGAALLIGTDSNARGCAIGDLNLDGKVDLVVACLGSNALNIFLGNGAGGFGPPVGRSVGTGPAAVTIGDIDHDGIPDIATANFFGNTATVLHGTGDGTTFLEFGTITTPANPVSIVIADVYRDGWPDIVTANYGANSITVSRINSSGGFGAQTSHTVGSVPTDIAVAIDRLGQTNFAVSNIGGSSANLVVLDATGALVSNGEYYAGGFDCHGVLLYDADGDGQLDIVTGNNGTGNVSLIKPTGDPRYLVPDSAFSFGGWRDIADVDLDGNLDMVAAAGSYSSTRLGNGDGTFSGSHIASHPTNARGLRLGDVDGDGLPDMLYLLPGTNIMLVSKNHGGGDFRFSHSTVTNSFPFGLAVGRFDRDTDLDVVVACPLANVASILYNDGTGAFTRADVLTDNNPVAVALGRLNEDPYADIVTANRVAGTVSVVLQDFGGGGTALPTVNYAAGADPVSVAIGDVNGDGVNDIVAANNAIAKFGVLLGNGDGTFATVMSYDAGGTPTKISLVDVNGDGRLDLVAGTTTGTGVSLGDGKGRFHPMTINVALASESSSEAADLSGDGRIDIIGGSGAPSDAIWLGLTPTHVTLSAPPLVVDGVPMTLSASVTWTGSMTPTGTVRFFDGTTLLGASTLANGKAGLTLPADFLGERQITAIFEGGGRFFGSFSNVVKQRVVATAKPSIASVADVKNDQGGRVRLRFASSPFDYPGTTTPILAYSIYRQVDPNFAPARLASRPNEADLYGWDFVLEMPATGESGYEVVAPTLADSNAAGVHNATFFVRASTAIASTFYDSSPVSGHSVDNLPPAPPAPFVATYSMGATHLHWGVNRESDLWYYALHRGTSAEFTPDPSNRIAADPDTGHTDVGPAGRYYKLAAVDVNGNISDYALMTPANTSDAGADPTLAFLLEGTTPNPSRDGRMRVQFTLPSAMPARLDLMDVSGRRVAILEVGSRGPGRHVVDLTPGERIRPGVYLLRLEQNGQTKAIRATVLD